MADKGGVLVVAETIDGALAPISAELVGAGTRLAEGLGTTASAVLLGSGLDAAAASLAALGPARVLVADDERLADLQADPTVATLAAIVAAEEPAAVLFGHTPNLREVADSARVPRWHRDHDRLHRAARRRRSGRTDQAGLRRRRHRRVRQRERPDHRHAAAPRVRAGRGRRRDRRDRQGRRSRRRSLHARRSSRPSRRPRPPVRASRTPRRSSRAVAGWAARRTGPSSRSLLARWARRSARPGP